MHRHQICLLASCSVLVSATASLAVAPPVVRTNGVTKEVPLCYIEMPNVPRQNLLQACMIGKQLPEWRPFDLKTDQNNDGVPDELAAFFDRSRTVFDMQPNATPAERQAQGAQQRAFMQEMARRLPVGQNIRAALNEMGDLMYRTSAAGRTIQPPELSRRNRRMEDLFKLIQKNPTIRKFEQYSNRYEANRRQANRNPY